MTIDLSTMSPASAERVLKALRALKSNPLAIYELWPPGEGGMSPGQRKAHEDPSRLRWLIAATQVGKTRWGAAEAWWASTGTHPYREPCEVPSEGWIMTPDLDGDWPKISAKLREVEPPGVLHERCRYDAARGYRYGSDRLVVLRNGAIMRPKSSSQDLQTLEGASIDWLWIDEVASKGHWFAALQRITAKHGMCWATFTPVGRPAAYLQEFLEGDPDNKIAPAPGWSKHKIKLTPANVPHRPPEWIEDQIALMDPWEIPQRRDAEWGGPAEGRRYSAWRPDLIIDSETLYAFHFDKFRVGIDHGEGTGKQRVVLMGFAAKRVVLISEWRSTGRDCTANQVATAILDTLKSQGISIHHLDRIVGDINTVGLGAGGGVRFNAFIEASLAEQLGLRQCPIQIDIPWKGPGSVLAGESAINTAMREGLFLAHDSCTQFSAMAQAYTGKEADLKDISDAVRYAIDDILLDPRRRVHVPTPALVTL